MSTPTGPTGSDDDQGTGGTEPVKPPSPSEAAARPSRRAIARRAAAQRPLRMAPPVEIDADTEPALPPQAEPAPVTPSPPGQSAAAPAESTAAAERALPGLVRALRASASVTGLRGDERETQVANVLAFLRRRLTGQYPVDEFGFDADFTEEVWLPLLRPLYRRWFRVEVRGVEHLPRSGAALMVANHSGTIPLDGLMLQVAVYDEIQRHARLLGADLVFQAPVLGDLARRSGATLATHPDAERLLRQGELTAVFPEGFKGVGKGFAQRYQLQRFGRGGFVTAAIRSGSPIVPCSIVGAEETYPMLGNASRLARTLGLPYFPITATFPWLGPLGAIPLPSKWIIEFGAPVPTAHLSEADADDPALVLDLTDQVRDRIQHTLSSLLSQRRSAFFS